MKFIFLHFFILFTFSTCNRINKNEVLDEDSIFINDLKTQEIVLDDYFEISRIVNLSEGIFDEIRNLQIVDSLIYFSTTSPSCLWTFDFNGILISKMCKQGKGKGEYMNIRDFQVVGDFLYILDRTGQKILQYSNQIIQKEYKLPFYASSFKVLKDNTVLLYANNENRLTNSALVLFDFEKSKIINSFFSYTGNTDHINIIERNVLNKFYIHENQSTFIRAFYDTIYVFQEDQLVKKISVNLNNENLPQEYLFTEYENIMSFFMKIRSTDFAFHIMNSIMSENYFVFDVEKSGHFYSVIHDLSTNENRIFTSIKDKKYRLVVNNLELVENWGPYFLTDQNEFVYFSPSEQKDQFGKFFFLKIRSN